MEEQHLQSVLESLEARTSRLEWRLRFTICGWLLTAAAGVACASFKRSHPKTQQTDEPADVLRVRRLIVVDDQGAERIVVGAPLPDRLVRGERRRRPSPATGVQLNDGSGNERGGVAMLDDGSMVLGIDDEQGEERAHLFYIPGRGAGLVMKDDEGKESLSLPDDNQSYFR